MGPEFNYEELYAAINKLEKGENLLDFEIPILVTFLKQGENVIYPSPMEYSVYRDLCSQLDVLDKERFPEHHRQLEHDLCYYDAKYHFQIRE